MQGQTAEELEEWLGADMRADNLPAPSWNIAPTQQIPVLLEDQRRAGVTRLESARWALTPPWSETLQTRTPLFNARIETVLEKPSFKDAVRKRRCLIPASGYYEWVDGAGAGAGAGGSAGGVDGGVAGGKRPRFIYASDGEPFAFAGIAGWWHDQAADAWHLTATMLTMDSYGPAEWIHPRIPVFASEEMWAEWLDPATIVDENLLEYMQRCAQGIGMGLESYEVAALKGDGPELIQRAG